MENNLINAAFYRGNKTFSVEQVKLKKPGPNEVAVKIAYVGICGTDMHVYLGHMDKRVGFERIIGHEMSGYVHQVGSKVKDFQVGQPVVVRPLDHCGECPACKSRYNHICHNLKFLGLDTDGALQEIWNVPSHTLHHLPEKLRMDYADLIEPVAVACHDIRLSRLKKDEDVLVIGGGPIGVLVAMVARDSGGRVIISEVNSFRLKIAQKLGFETINPKEINLIEEINKKTNQKGADVVFEVSGSQTGVDVMTDCAATRGRIVMVAIHAEKPVVDMFRFFWRELELIGVRVYEKEDYEKAIKILVSGRIDANTIITDVNNLDDVQTAFNNLSNSPTALKSLIKVGD